MPHNLTLITTIVAALGAALALGFLAARLKLPVLIGYLAAGIIIGPFTLSFAGACTSVITWLAKLSFFVEYIQP